MFLFKSQLLILLFSGKAYSFLFKVNAIRFPMAFDKKKSNYEETTIRHLKPHEADGIIFDVDGTLANSWKLGFDATQVILQKNNLPLIDEDLYHQCTRYSTPERLARHAGLDPDTDTDFWSVGNRLADEFDSLYVDLVSIQTAGFYDGIHDLILKLNEVTGGRVRIAALTNACVAYAHSVLKTNCPKTSFGSDREGIYEKFVSIHGADTVAKPKPHPDGIIQCCQEIGVDPHRCVYIGDSPSDGIAAKAAGCISIGVLWGSHSEESLRQAPFDHICWTVDDLRDLLIK
jgi:haloacid dehalogenase superfamily, subfamily IA, variant 1 with third motif having Dx(3-4)D or Dx(3-4)E